MTNWKLYEQTQDWGGDVKDGEWEVLNCSSLALMPATTLNIEFKARAKRQQSAE